MNSSRPVRIAVYFDQKIQAGGGYQQALNAAISVKKLPKSLAEPIFFVKHAESTVALKAYNIDSILVKISFFSKVFTRIRRKIKNQLFLQIIKRVFGPNDFEKYFIKNKIDLIYFLSPSPEAEDLEELNFFITIWDLCFREDVEFPEVRLNRAFENRNELFGKILPKASAIIVDSENGQNNLLRYYGIDLKRIIVIPFTPAQSVQGDPNLYDKSNFDISANYCLDNPYVFYPAQFWAHKNHAFILRGLKALETRYGYIVGAIFCGENKGNLTYIQNLAKELGIFERIRFLGFVENSIIPYLYRQSLALVMPTYFGPTNLPPYEAFSLGVPVLYSDKPGLRDHVNGAALMLDLTDPNSMAKNLAYLIEDDKLVGRLVESGKELLEQVSSYDRLESLSNSIESFRHRLITWC